MLGLRFLLPLILLTSSATGFAASDFAVGQECELKKNLVGRNKAQLKKTKTKKLTAGQVVKIDIIKPKWSRVFLGDKSYFILSKVLRRNCKQVVGKDKADSTASAEKSGAKVCTLKAPLKVRSKPRLKRVKVVELALGTELSVAKRLKKWTQVRVEANGSGKWWVKPGTLEKTCIEGRKTEVVAFPGGEETKTEAAVLDSATAQDSSALASEQAERIEASDTALQASTSVANEPSSPAPAAQPRGEASLSQAQVPEPTASTSTSDPALTSTPSSLPALAPESAPVPTPQQPMQVVPVQAPPTTVSPTTPQAQALDALAESQAAPAAPVMQEESVPAKQPVVSATPEQSPAKKKRSRRDYYIDFALGAGLSDLHASALGGLAGNVRAGFGLIIADRLRLGTSANALGQFNAWQNNDLVFANRLAGYLELGILPQYNKNWHIHLGAGYAAGIKVRREDDRVSGQDILRLKGFVYLGPAWTAGFTYDLINFSSLDLTVTFNYTGANLQYYRIIHSGITLFGLSWM